MIHWLEHNAWWLMAASAVIFLGGIVVACVFAVRMPVDYFVRPEVPAKEVHRRHPAIRMTLLVVKNMAGAVMLVLGIILALPVVPGPGLMFILLGVMLLDIPGKRKMERYIVTRPVVLRPINALRVKFHRPPLQIPDGPG